MTTIEPNQHFEQPARRQWRFAAELAARVTATVPANLPLGVTSNSNITALPTTSEVLEAGTGWQAAPAAGAQTNSGNHVNDTNADDVSIGKHFDRAGPARSARFLRPAPSKCSPHRLGQALPHRGHYRRRDEASG